MKKSKTISITTESREIFILYAAGRKRLRELCPECGQESEWLSLDEAANSTAHRTRELIGLIDSGLAHSSETASGHLLVCKRSLEIRAAEKEAHCGN
jgi:hypothetical protein